MKYEIASDMELVREIMTHPKVWPYITDDGSPAAEDFAPTVHHAVIYLTCTDGEDLLGMWMFLKRNAVTLEVHTCLLPGHGFTRARTAARGAAEWVWANCPRIQRITTSVPRGNRLALKFALDVGMDRFGTDPNSFLKDGILQDQTLLGLSRPKETQCQQQ